MKRHELRTDHEVFQASWDGLKLYEIRKDDRGFAVNDILHLRETVHTGEQMRAGFPLEYTGRELVARIVHILRGPVYGLQEGWAIMNIRSVRPIADELSMV